MFHNEWLSAYDPDKDFLEIETFKDIKKPGSSNIKPWPHILHNLSIHNIVPYAGRFEKVLKQDVIMIYHLVHKKYLHLGYLFLKFMKNDALINRSFPYGMLMTLTFKNFNLYLQSKAHVKLRNVIHESRLGRMGVSI